MRGVATVKETTYIGPNRPPASNQRGCLNIRESRGRPKIRPNVNRIEPNAKMPNVAQICPISSPNGPSKPASIDSPMPAKKTNGKTHNCFIHYLLSKRRRELYLVVRKLQLIIFSKHNCYNRNNSLTRYIFGKNINAVKSITLLCDGRDNWQLFRDSQTFSSSFFFCISVYF